MGTINNSNKSKLYLTPYGSEINKRYIKDYELLKMYNITTQIFKYSNLPETIPARDLELITQSHGFSVFTKVNNEYYIFFGGLGGVPNEYYLPTQAIVANPYLKYFDTLEINKDCVVIRNDKMYMGLNPIHEIYADLLAENTLSLKRATINTRALNVFCAMDDNTKQSMERVLKKIDEGLETGVIGSNAIIDGTKSIPLNGNYCFIKDLIEERQYLKSNWWIELGINSNFNMKREAINEEELNVNELALLPLLDDMLEERKEAIKKINAMYGLNISVDFSSSWKKLRQDIERDEKLEQQEINKMVEEPSQESKEESKEESEVKECLKVDM